MYEFGGGKASEHIGGIYDYLSKKKLNSLHQLELSSSAVVTNAARSKLRTDPHFKQTLPEQRLSRRQRKLERDIEEAEDKIGKLETEILELETELATPEGAVDTKKLQKYLDTKKHLESFMNKWEKLTLELEKFTS